MTNPAETQPTTSEVINEPPEAATAKQAEQEPKNHLAVIAEVKDRTGVGFKSEQVKIVVETITNLADNPEPQLVMDTLCKIAEQLGAKLTSFPDQYLPEFTKQKWQEISGVQPAEKVEPIAQAEGEIAVQPSDSSSEAVTPPTNEVVAGWRPIDVQGTMDPSGGPQGAPGKLMNEIVQKP